MVSETKPVVSAFLEVVPRQHGAWAVLLFGLALGTAASSPPGLASAYLLGTVIAGFIARHAASLYLRSLRSGPPRPRLILSAVIAAGHAVGFGGVLIFRYGLEALLPLAVAAGAAAAISLVVDYRGEQFSVGGELVGILSLTLVAPAAEYVSSGVVTQRTWGIWILCALFFSGSVFHVRYLARCRDASIGVLDERLRAGGTSIAYHLAALAAAGALAFADVVPWVGVLALVPVTAKALWFVLRRRREPVPIRRIGYMEVAHGLVFVSLAVLAFRCPACL